MTTTLKRSASALAIRVFLLLFIIDTAYALLILLFLGAAPPADYYMYFVVFLWALHSAKYIVISFILLRTLLEWLGTTYTVNGKHLTVRTGAYSVSEKVYELDQLKQIKVHQDWFGRLFHYGNLTLQVSSSGFRELIGLHDVTDPRKYEAALADEFV